MTAKADTDSIGDIAVKAARAMDLGDYKEVLRLIDQLRERGVPEDQILKAFCEQGASPALIPAEYTGCNCSLLPTLRADIPPGILGYSA